LVVTWTGAPGALDFGGAQIEGGTVQRTITIANPAPGNEALTFAVDVTQGATDYAVTAPAELTLDVGESIEVTITFDPTTLGTRTGEVTVTADDALNPSAS